MTDIFFLLKGLPNNEDHHFLFQIELLAGPEAPFVSHCSVTKSTLYFADTVASLSLKPDPSSQNSCIPLHEMLKFCIAVSLLALLPNPLLEDHLVLGVRDII
jgi:hypothetical protein